MSKIPAYYEKTSLYIRIYPLKDEDIYAFFIIYHNNIFYLFNPGGIKPCCKTNDPKNIMDSVLSFTKKYTEYKKFELAFYGTSKIYNSLDSIKFQDPPKNKEHLLKEFYDLETADSQVISIKDIPYETINENIMRMLTNLIALSE